MNRIDALKELLAKVEAGNIPVLSWQSFAALAVGSGVYVDPQAQTAMRAYCGSLDAAKALHEAVLPGCHFVVTNEASGYGYVAEVFDCEADMTIGHGHAGNPARAWLIAILKALIAEANGREGGE